MAPRTVCGWTKHRVRDSANKNYLFLLSHPSYNHLFLTNFCVLWYCSQFIERVNQALAVSSKKVDMLEICLDKMDDFIEILAQSDPVSLPKILNLYCQLVDKDNTEWALVPSEKLQCSRVSSNPKTITNLWLLVCSVIIMRTGLSDVFFNAIIAQLDQLSRSLPRR